MLTVEPAIYIPEEGFAVRLENDVLVTDKEPVDLLADIPIEAEEIDELTNQRGIDARLPFGGNQADESCRSRAAFFVRALRSRVQAQTTTAGRTRLLGARDSDRNSHRQSSTTTTSTYSTLGWEGIGHWNAEAELSELSSKAHTPNEK